MHCTLDSVEPTRRPPEPEGRGPWGDVSRHLPLAAIEQGLSALSPPRDRGRLALIVSRSDGEERCTPETARLTREGGVPSDRWRRSAAHKPDAQITMMRVDFGRLVANGQDLTLFGDNLLVDLDLSVANLPTGSRLRVGAALLEVTPEPHDGCRKYRQRFGADALRATAAPGLRDLRLRGIYVKVIEDGEVALEDPVEVLSRSSA